MKTFCKKKSKQARCKKRNLELFQETATFRCKKCDRLSVKKSDLCKPKKV